MDNIIQIIGRLLELNSQDEFLSVVWEHQEILQDENIGVFVSLAQEYEQDGETEITERLRMVAAMLVILKEALAKQSQPQVEPIIKESTVGWARLARQYLASQKEEILSEAIESARKANEPEVLELLVAYKNYDLDQLRLWATELFERFQSENKQEEAFTCALLELDSRAALTEFFIQYPIERQAEFLDMGINASLQAVQISEMLNDEGCQAFFLGMAGDGYKRRREFSKAEESYQAALSLYKKLAKSQPEVYKRDIAVALNNLGNLQSELRDFEAAETSYNEALSLCRKVAKSQSEVYEPDVAATLNNLGNSQGGLQKFEAAEASYKEVLSILYKLAKSQPEIYEHSLAETLNNLGALQVELRKFEAAEESLKEALSIRRKLANLQPEFYEPSVAMTLNNLGNLQRALGKFEAAEANLLESLQLAHKYDLPVNILRACSNLSRIKLAQERWSEGESHLRIALAQVERLRTETLSISRRQQVIKDNIQVFENLVVCLVKQGKFLEALEIAEQGKGRTLADLLSMQEFRPQNVSDELWQEYRLNVQRIQELETLLSPENLAELRQRNYGTNGSDERLANDTDAPHFAAEIEQWQREINEARQRRDLSFAEFRRLDPDYLPAVVPLKINEIQQLACNTNKTLIMFRVTPLETYVFFVFPDATCETLVVPDFTAATLNSLLVKHDENGEAIEGWIYRYYKYLSAEKNTVEKLRAEKAWLAVIETTLAELYNDLLGKVHEVLRRNANKMTTNNLVIVPNRGLAVLPLDAASWTENGATRYLIDEYNITYAPSLYSFKRCLTRDAATPKPDKLFLLVNPTQDLDYATPECEEIRRMFAETHTISLLPARVGNILTDDEVIAAMSANNWLHFSCHGKYNMDLPLQSKLLLKYGKKPDDEHSLSLNEVMKTDLRNTWLTVLSACETGLTHFRETSDEYVGFPFGFIFAGAPTVWGTLYSVDDESTKELMIRAYQNLKNGASKADALREAQLSLRNSTTLENNKNYSHPFYWSAFHNVGA